MREQVMMLSWDARSHFCPANLYAQHSVFDMQPPNRIRCAKHSVSFCNFPNEAIKHNTSCAGHTCNFHILKELPAHLYVNTLSNVATRHLHACLAPGIYRTRHISHACLAPAIYRTRHFARVPSTSHISHQAYIAPGIYRTRA